MLDELTGALGKQYETLSKEKAMGVGGGGERKIKRKKEKKNMPKPQSNKILNSGVSTIARGKKYKKAVT